ncbi:ATP-dependent RNA helicase TDRD9 isoform X1 [Synchiropus splendidus]|uniref:ATP-dependent RNA helicase TDRD9 isoform X1 n=1 Tax=Synchiropus splendidus TaxID=270530 RepID=UPI00237E3930|nr:ATP-dependent RNA helicase TDRD9 isoform X1 [Synchiropus splendidus]
MDEAKEAENSETLSKVSSPPVELTKNVAPDTKDEGSESKNPNQTPPPPPGHKYPELPITKSREKLVSLIEYNSVVIIRGATGSGKTTQVPQYILDHYAEKNMACNIVVTQPRRIGATSVAHWVAQQRKCVLGSLVGHQIGLEKVANEHTRLLYVTTGVLLHKLVSAKCLTEFTHIFVDEVHERTAEMDLLLLVLRRFLQTNSPFVKIILMSATINCSEFANYFSTSIRGMMSPAYVFEVEGIPHAIDLFYLDDLHHLFPNKFQSPHLDEPYISEDMYKLAVNLIRSLDEMEGEESRRVPTDGGLALTERGSVLVFLPGIREIMHMQDCLVKLVHKRLLIYPLHSAVTLGEQKGVFQPPVLGCRKVILSTNIAESSVTVPDVKYVIDFCLVRRMVCDEETNCQSLRLSWAAKNNCDQRRGRAGRVSKGFCYRLVTKYFWTNDIPDYMIPEMLVVPLSSVLLKVKLLGMADPRSILATALSPPNLTDIVKTVLQLKEMGALSAQVDGKNYNEDGELTFLGRVLAHLPLNLNLGKLVVLGHVFGCLDECLIIAAAHSQKNFFAKPPMLQVNGHRSKLSFTRSILSDSIACLNAFKAWDSAKKKGLLRGIKEELDWGHENLIQVKRIREVAEQYEELKRRVRVFNMLTPDSPESLDYTSVHKRNFLLQMVIAGAFYPNYFVQGEIDDALACRELSGFNPRTTVMLRRLPPYSFLYYRQLQNLFRSCGQIKTMSFESTRAYVEFSGIWQGTGVLQEVTLALFLAKHRLPLILSVHPSEHVLKSVGNRCVDHLKHARVNIDFRNGPVTSIGFENTLDPERLPASPLFVVNITEVVEVGHFWGFRADEASLEKQRHLTDRINSSALQPVTVALHPNLLCLAPFPESDGESLYYRAQVRHIRGTVVEVFFLDFGNSSSVTSDCLRELPPDLLTPPFQAQEFQVIEMRPSPESIINGGRWSSRARARFITLVKGRLPMVSLYSILSGVMRVELLFSSGTDGSSSTSLMDILVEEGHAIKAEESFDSKQSHQVLLSLYRDMERGLCDGSPSSSWLQRNKQDKQLVDEMLENFSKSCVSVSKSQVKLNGPTSPYKTEFHSLCHKTHNKSVVVERDSVCSLVVNESPHYKDQRMLVAERVSVNAAGTNFCAHEASLLPHIPGLPALITMIFTPSMELRTNKEQTCYTGALCGLGFHTQTQASLLPEHDIELAFDVKFDFEDIVQINTLRLAINRLVCDSPHSVQHQWHDRISLLQDECQESLLRLFTKSRDAVTPVYFQQERKWNQVDSSMKMFVTEEGVDKTPGVLFQLHPVLLLNG